ncbi:MAG: glycoside hydrolase family 25, partial [Sphingomonadaceae bacterium]|nr:glycoside hydrolase family 25 [Sphingomonadaceae bacterium]
GARAAGVRHGEIHRWNLCRLASDQATNFIATVPADADALPPAVMLEFSESCPDRPGREVLLDELASFLALIEPRAGKPALLYVTRDFDAEYDVTANLDRRVWLDRRLFPPDYGGPWVMWQASDIRRVDGIEHPVRWNVVRP